MGSKWATVRNWKGRNYWEVRRAYLKLFHEKCQTTGAKPIIKMTWKKLQDTYSFNQRQNTTVDMFCFEICSAFDNVFVTGNLNVHPLS